MLSAKRIAAGKSGRIEVSIKTESLIGPVEKLINVTTNDPRQSTVALVIKAQVEREIEVSEPSIYFGNTPQGKEVSREIIITLPADKAIRILKTESMDPNVAVKMEPVGNSGGKKFKLTATQKADAKLGYHFGRIVIKTSSSYAPDIFIDERGIVAALGH